MDIVFFIGDKILKVIEKFLVDLIEILKFFGSLFIVIIDLCSGFWIGELWRWIKCMLVDMVLVELEVLFLYVVFFFFVS